jgi:hypothetical protein
MDHITMVIMDTIIGMEVITIIFIIMEEED